MTRSFDALTGRGVRVLVIDSGVDGSHPALAAAPITYFAIDGTIADRVARVVPAESRDPIGHGTAVASIIRRYAPDAELSSLAVLGRQNRGTTENLFVALDWAANRSFDVINISLGTSYLALLSKFKERLDRLYLCGTIVVAACSNLHPNVVEYPAHFTSVISVEPASLPALAVERTLRLVEFRALGIDVEAAWRGGLTVSVTGSSFAAPHVSALVARIRERHPQWNLAQVKSALYDHAVSPTGSMPETK